MAKEGGKRRDRRNFTEDFKKQVVEEINAGKKVIDAAQEYDISASQLSQWRKRYGSAKKSRREESSTNGTSAQSASSGASQSSEGRSGTGTGRGSSSRRSSSSASSSPDIAEFERVIGQLTIENMRLRNELDNLRSR